MAVIVVCVMRNRDNDGASDEVEFNRTSVPMSVLQQANPQVTSFRDEYTQMPMPTMNVAEASSTRSTAFTASSRSAGAGGSEYAVRLNVRILSLILVFLYFAFSCV